MKGCPTRLQLEAAVLAEAPAIRLAEFDAHASGCPRCRHELSWLRSEAALIAQRRAREEVGRLWDAVDARSPSRRGRGLTRAMLALAASALIAVGVGRAGLGPRGAHGTSLEAPPMSLETMSVDPGDGALASMPCYTPGFGIACGEVQYATR